MLLWLLGEAPLQISVPLLLHQDLLFTRCIEALQGFFCTEHFAPTLRGIRSFEGLQGPTALNTVLQKALERQGKMRQKMSFLAWDK